MFWNKIFFGGLALIGFSWLLAGPLWAQGEQEEFANNQATFTQLKETQVNVDWFEARFVDVLKELTSETGLIFVLDESASDNALDGETIISCKYSGVRVATVLDLLLDEYSCTWCIQDGVVKIVSEDSALDQRNLNLMAFDCKHLIAKIQPITKRRFGNSRGFGSSASQGTASQSGGVFRVTPPIKMPLQESDAKPTVAAIEANTPAASGASAQASQLETANQETANQETANQETANQTAEPQPRVYEYTISGREQLMDTIMEAVDPDSWEDNGGNARIMSLNDVILISNTQKNLRAIDQLLKQLNSVGLDE